MSIVPIISQLKSAWQFVTGDAEGAKKTWDQFTDAWTNHPGQTIGEMADSIPLIGHIKGIVHLVRGERDEFWQSEEQATRTLVVLGAGALTVSTGGAAAPILAGVVAGVAYDGVVTGIESARHKSFQPQGYIAAGREVAGDARGGVFDLVALGVGDGWLGSEGGSARTTKVYRVEGESYVKTRSGISWESNRRLFADGDGVIVNQDSLPTVKYYPRWNKGEGKAVVLGLSGKARSGNMLFLNYGERARADAFYAQRVLQYREAVDAMQVRGTTPLHNHHNMRIKSFRIMTRAAKDLQRRAITEPEKAEGLKPYDGVLQVDITKARGQYGCERRIYSPLLRNAIRGSYTEFTPWLEHLPTRVLQLIKDHQVAYGSVRVVFVALGGVALPSLLNFFLHSDFANRLSAGSSDDKEKLVAMPLPLSQFNDGAISHIQVRDAPIVGLRQSREAKCGRQLLTDIDHGKHFEYLAEFPDGSSHWYPSTLIAKDLMDEFESLSMSHASEVAEIVQANGINLTVRRRDNTIDTVHQNQLFWEEDTPEGLGPLHDEEMDCLIYHGHNDEHLDHCVPATLTFHSDWARIDVTTAGTTFRKDDAFDQSVYSNVTFTNTSIMWGQPHAEKFRKGTVPFVIVNHGAWIDIKITHGRDGAKLEDQLGSASASYGNSTYSSKTTPLAGATFVKTPLFNLPSGSYAIHLTVRQRGFSFFLVEHVIWSFDTASAVHAADGWIISDTTDHTLFMSTSGTSGALLFQAENGERMLVVVGVHNFVRWCDIVINVSPRDSAGKILAMYYNKGPKEYMRWKTLQEYRARSERETDFRIVFDVAEGNRLTAQLFIS